MTSAIGEIRRESVALNGSACGLSGLNALDDKLSVVEIERCRSTRPDPGESSVVSCGTR